MRVVIRGVKNAFRNLIRTVSVTLILALSIGLALVMLLSYQAVGDRIANVKASVGTTITVNPAGAQGFQGGGEPLTDAQLTTVRGIENVESVSATLMDRLTAGTDTTLQSAIEAGTLGNRSGQQQLRQFEGDSGPGGTSTDTDTSSETRTFTPPITVTGLSDISTVISGDTKLTSGELFSSDSTDAVAVIGSELATKNSLSVGSTFTAYDKEFKVVGIYDAGNQFANGGLYVPVKTLQSLSDQAGQYNSFTVTADTMDHVDATVSAIQSKLGSDTVDVTSNLDTATNAVEPLESIRSISLYSLIGSLIAGAVITLLIMMMIVRERRREIGVLKAIGSSNVGIVTQFVSESLVLTLMGSVVGIVLGVLLSNPVLSILVKNSSTTTTASEGVRMAGGPAGRFAMQAGQAAGGVRDAVNGLQASVGIDIILYGFAAALLIAIIGSAIPAFLIAKIKPAEVMRAE